MEMSVCHLAPIDGYWLVEWILASGSKDGTIRLWALWKVRLKQLIAESTSPEHVKWVEDTMREENLTAAERKWLELLLPLMHWQVRGEVENDETS